MPGGKSARARIRAGLLMPGERLGLPPKAWTSTVQRNRSMVPNLSIGRAASVETWSSSSRSVDGGLLTASRHGSHIRANTVPGSNLPGLAAPKHGDPRDNLNPTMPRHRLTTALLAVAGPLLATCGMARAPLQEVTLQHGPFEIVAKGRLIESGAFPNQGGSPFAKHEVSSFSVRWHGQTVNVPGRGDRFWNVLRLTDAPRPALLLVQRSFTLVTEQDGQLQVQPLVAASNGLAEAQWLDSEAGQPGEPLFWGMSHIDIATGTVLQGGRFLRLGSQLVLDVQQLALHTIDPWAAPPPGGSHQGFAPSSDDGARAFSPGRTQIVLAGWKNDDSRRLEARYGLIVVNLKGGDNYELALDRRRTPFDTASSITSAWIHHYFEWKQQAGGRERLVPRAGARPLPWRGQLKDDPTRRPIVYSVSRARSALIPEMRRVMLALPGAELVPDGVDPRRGIDGYTVRVDGCLFGISSPDSAYPEAGSPEWEFRDGGSVSVYPAKASDREAAACIPTLRRIAQAMDAELATGCHDRHIVLD